STGRRPGIGAAATIRVSSPVISSHCCDVPPKARPNEDRSEGARHQDLRDAGMEVIYTPPWQAIDAVVKLALEEDVDVIGISSLATDHRIVPKLMRALKHAEVDGVAVIVGGIVPDADEALLIEAGVARVF